MKICLKLVQSEAVENGPGTDSMQRLLFVCNFNLALLYLNVHEHDLAVVRLKHAEKVEPLSPDVAFLRGFIRRRRGNYARSRVDYVLASKLKLRADLGPAAAALVEHSHSSKEARKIQELHRVVVQSPVKKSQILSFLTSTQKSLITLGPDRNEMHLQYIAALLMSQTWFKKLSEEKKRLLCKGLEYFTLGQGEWIFQRGDVSDAFYLIVAGTMNVMVIDVSIGTETHGGTLGKNDTFGEISLLKKKDRTASVISASAAELVKIPVHLFDQCNVRAAIEAVSNDKRDAIIMSNVLNGLPEKFVTDATDFATIKIYEQGELLVRQGQHSECLFIMMQGVCDVNQKIDIREELVHRKKMLKDELESLKKKYVYHHQILEDKTMEERMATVREETLMEKKMGRFEKELDIIQCQISEIDRQKMAHYRKQSRWKRLVPANLREKDSKTPKKVLLKEIMAPSFFGEASLRGDGSLEHVEVIASTRVVVLRIFMSQMDFSKVSDEFLERLSNLSAVKPLSLEDLSARSKGEQGWMDYRKTLMTFVNKMKWPVRNGHVTPGANGTSLIHKLAEPNGAL